MISPSADPMLLAEHPAVRTGGAAPATVRRIVILKLDHVGDLLIAAPALAMIRRSFGTAHITLLCAPWNVALARRLGVADDVHAIGFFAQASGADAGTSMDERRQQAAAAIAALRLAPADLAIDLRRDEDTRPLLKVVDARIRAGFGDLATYGYLDAAIAVTHSGEHAGASSLLLGPDELDNGVGHARSDTGLHLTVNTGTVDLAIRTDTVWSPAEDGVPDNRELGVALHGIHVQPSIEGFRGFPREVMRDGMRFGPGWLGWEPWGRWSSIEEAHIELTLRTPAKSARVLLRLQGHTSDRHPQAVVGVADAYGGVERRFMLGEEAAVLALDCRVVPQPPKAASAPTLLRAGRYRGCIRLDVPELDAWMPLILRVRGALVGQVLATLELPKAVPAAGVLEFPFEVELLDTGEPIVVEITCDRHEPNPRLAIRSVELECRQARSPFLPVSHMEDRLQELASMIAIRFGAGPVRWDEAHVVRRLTEPRAGSTATQAVAALRRRRRATHGFWRARPTRRVLGIGLGANKETKLWPLGASVELCRHLLGHPEVTLAFIGGPADRARTTAVIEALTTPERVVDLCGCCRIEDLGEILAQLSGFIGFDTGTTHFAGRIGLPTFALFGASHDPAEWGPVGGRSGWAALDVGCRGCSLALASQCRFEVACMRDLTPASVWPSIERFFFAEAV